MSYSIVVKTAAELDIQEAYQYYEAQKSGFVRAVDSCFSKIGRSPNAYPVVHEQIRRSLIHRFPYGIFYTIEGDTIAAIACFHARRNPKDWSSRS